MLNLFQNVVKRNLIQLIMIQYYIILKKVIKTIESKTFICYLFFKLKC